MHGWAAAQCASFITLPRQTAARLAQRASGLICGDLKDHSEAILTPCAGPASRSNNREENERLYIKLGEKITRRTQKKLTRGYLFDGGRSDEQASKTTYEVVNI